MEWYTYPNGSIVERTTDGYFWRIDYYNSATASWTIFLFNNRDDCTTKELEIARQNFGGGAGGILGTALTFDGTGGPMSHTFAGGIGGTLIGVWPDASSPSTNVGFAAMRACDWDPGTGVFIMIPTGPGITDTFQIRVMAA